MTTLRWTRRRKRNKKTGRTQVLYDLAIWRGGRLFASTRQGYTRLSTLQRVFKGIACDVKSGKVRNEWRGLFKRLALIATLSLLTSHLALAINSPRPASYRLQDNALTMTWTNLNPTYPRTLSYRSDTAAPWQWETNRLWPDATGTLVITRPVTEPAMFYRLWPAAP